MMFDALRLRPRRRPTDLFPKVALTITLITHVKKGYVSKLPFFAIDFSCSYLVPGIQIFN
jgi:hypothetical protein